jgi:hypothetical protein
LAEGLLPEITGGRTAEAKCRMESPGRKDRGSRQASRRLGRRLFPEIPGQTAAGDGYVPDARPCLCYSPNETR